MNINNIQVGDVLYVMRRHGGAPEKCHVIELSNEGVRVKFKIGESLYPAALLHFLFTSEEECRDFVAREREVLKEAYLKEINSIKDLVMFMYSHNVCPCEEYTDWVAREVAELCMTKYGIKY